mmetsp:Transcript_9184/g.13425  ORF Transcript_9184/g.13425 Transcript_9184/m.13425 type:complete len:363 (+) Transcript_9184:281-1369(+)
MPCLPLLQFVHCLVHLGHVDRLRVPLLVVLPKHVQLIARQLHHALHPPRSRDDRSRNLLLRKDGGDPGVREVHVGRGRNAHLAVGAVDLQHAHVGANVGIGGVGIQDDVKLAGQIGHFVNVAEAGFKKVRASLHGSAALRLGTREGRDLSAEEPGEANGSSSQTSDGGDGDGLARLDIVHDRLENGATSADEGTRHLGGKGVGQLNGESLLYAHHLGHAAAVLVVRVFAPDAGCGAEVRSLVSLLAKIFASGEAGVAGKAGISRPCDAYHVAHLKVGAARSNAADASNAFVSEYYGVVGDAPVIVSHVNICVAQSVVNYVALNHGRLHGRERNVLQDELFALSGADHSLGDERAIFAHDFSF